MNTKTIISFDDTSIAFAHKSNLDLKKRHRLFVLMNQNWLVKIGTFFIKTALKLKLPVKGLLRHNMYDHFCGGESIQECDNTIRELASHNIGTILDYAVEGEKSEKGFDHNSTTRGPTLNILVFKSYTGGVVTGDLTP